MGGGAASTAGAVVSNSSAGQAHGGAAPSVSPTSTTGAEGEASDTPQATSSDSATVTSPQATQDATSSAAPMDAPHVVSPARTMPEPIFSSFAPDLEAWTVKQSGGGDPDTGNVTVDSGDAVMREGNSFLVTLEHTFVVPTEPWTIAFEYSQLENIQVSLASFALPQIVFGALRVGITALWGKAMHPVFEARTEAIFAIAQGKAVGEAFDTYVRATKTISIGFQILGASFELVDLAENFAGLISSVNSSSTALTVEERIVFRLPLLLDSLRKSADSIKSWL